MGTCEMVWPLILRLWAGGVVLNGSSRREAWPYLCLGWAECTERHAAGGSESLWESLSLEFMLDRFHLFLSLPLGSPVPGFAAQGGWLLMDHLKELSCMGTPWAASGRHQQKSVVGGG